MTRDGRPGPGHRPRPGVYSWLADRDWVMTQAVNAGTGEIRWTAERPWVRLTVVASGAWLLTGPRGVGGQPWVVADETGESPDYVIEAACLIVADRTEQTAER